MRPQGNAKELQVHDSQASEVQGPLDLTPSDHAFAILNNLSHFEQSQFLTIGRLS
jgi:hypothetical protein